MTAHLVARILSMGKLHHAMTDTAAIALATAAVVHRIVARKWSEA
jgi:2-methylaconitate cis-trans-isomerase PrpF